MRHGAALFLQAFILQSFILVGLFLGVSAYAQSPPQVGYAPPVFVDDAFNQQAIGLSLDLFEDKNAKLTLDEIRSRQVAQQFKPSTQAIPNFGYTSSAHWARFVLRDERGSIRHTSGTTLYLTLASAVTDTAEFWCANAQGAIVLQQRAGVHVPFADWPMDYREPVFKIDKEVQTCWMRVHSGGSVQFPLSLQVQDAFVGARIADTNVQALYFGALLVMIAYNGLVSVSTLSLAYGSYTLFLLSFGLFQAALSGIGYAHLWPHAAGAADFFIPAFIAMVGIFSISFAIVLLDLRKLSPRWYWFGLTLLALYAVMLLLLWFLPYPIAIRTVLLISPLWFTFVLGSAFTVASQGVRVAKIYLVAWFVFIIGTVSLIAQRLGWLPANVFTVNTQQIGSVIEFLLLSFALSDRIKTLQNQLLASTKAELDALAKATRAETETILAKVQTETQQAHNQALQVQAELARKDAELAQKESDYTKDQLQQADKMASLGQLVASVTHEINTPIGAISSSGSSITEALGDVIQQLPPLLQQLDNATGHLLVELLQQANQPKAAISSREERVIIKKATEQLEAAGLEQARQKAGFLVGFNAQSQIEKYLPLLQHPQAEEIQQAARNLSNAMGNARNVNLAVDRVTKIVKALKSFSHFNIGTEKIEANLAEGMETVLTIYQGQTKVGVEVVRNYDDIPHLNCFPDDLNQVWTNLIHNALQAMNHEGVLTVGIRQENGNAVVSVTDSGCGIPEEIRGKIFDVFFTTKPAGVGSGLGLDIVKKIIEKNITNSKTYFQMFRINKACFNLFC